MLNAKIRNAVSHCIRIVFCSAISTVILRKIHLDGDKALDGVDRSMGEDWSDVLAVFEMMFEDGTLVQETLEGLDLWSDTTGVDALSALLELLTSPERTPSFASVALKILTSDTCIKKIITESDRPEEEWDAFLDEESVTSVSDFLVMGGVHPELARNLQGASPEKLLLLWALLLVNLESGTPSHRQFISHILRNVPSLIHAVLEALCDLLPLLHLPRKNADSIQQRQTESVLTAIEQGTSSSLSRFLQSTGVPRSETQWSALAIKMYSSMLRALPVSVRVWFHDLKAKHLRESIQHYTTICESPLLIQHEFSQLNTLKDRAQGSGDYEFRGSPGRREVVTTVTVEEDTKVEMRIKIPQCMPLKAMTVTCDPQVKCFHSAGPFLRMVRPRCMWIRGS